MERNSDFTRRISEMLTYFNCTQADIVSRTNLNKAIVSRYVSGKALPRAETLNTIAKAFNVNPLWLMGYKVSMFELPMSDEERTPNFDRLNMLNRKLTEEQRGKIIEMIEIMYFK